MKKKRKDQKGERGSIVMACGYTTNAKPGPRRQAKEEKNHKWDYTATGKKILLRESQVSWL